MVYGLLPLLCGKGFDEQGQRCSGAQGKEEGRCGETREIRPWGLGRLKRVWAGGCGFPLRAHSARIGGHEIVAREILCWFAIV